MQTLYPLAYKGGRRSVYLIRKAIINSGGSQLSSRRRTSRVTKLLTRQEGRTARGADCVVALVNLTWQC